MSKKTDDLTIEMHTDIKWIKQSLETKANKWVEKVMKGMIGTVLFCVLGALMGLVIAPSVMAIAYITFNKFI